MITRVISGGQTGADFGGLLGARDASIPTGGWAPKDWCTEAEPNPQFKDFGLKESEFWDYRIRTNMNVKDSECTVLFTSNSSSPETIVTRKACQIVGRPFIMRTFNERREPNVEALEILDLIQPFMKHGTLNVAGNRESISPGIEAWVRQVVRHLCEWSRHV